MKYFLFLIVGVFSFSANASFVQENCSNAEATTRYSQGHDQNNSHLTLRFYVKNKEVNAPLKHEDGELKVTKNSEALLVTEVKNTCKPGDTDGVESARVVHHRNVTLQKADGSDFDKRIVGVSSDLKSVTADMICEEYSDGLVPCP